MVRNRNVFIPVRGRGDEAGAFHYPEARRAAPAVARDRCCCPRSVRMKMRELTLVPTSLQRPAFAAGM
jgi:hypothetical protein